jgi:hypothetical protein
MNHMKRSKHSKKAGLQPAGRRYVKDAMPIWKVAADLGKRIPKEEWAKVPRDLAKNVDHYLYGAAKAKA